LKIQSRCGVRSVAAAVAVAGLLWTTSAASASPPAPVPSSNPVTVDYTCFVTFPGGSTFVPFSLTYGVTAPKLIGPPRKFDVVIDPPTITPNPAFQLAVKNVAVVYRLPENARLTHVGLSGGSNLGLTPPTVERSGDVLVLRAAGPFTAGVPFDLPTLVAGLKAHPHAGIVETTTGGTSHADPSFSWTRIDTAGTERPFMCQPPAAVAFSSTTVIH